MTRRLRSTPSAAVATLDDMLVGVLETVREARRVPGLPTSLRESVDELAAEVARLQAITEWAIEGLIEFR